MPIAIDRSVLKRHFDFSSSFRQTE